MIDKTEMVSVPRELLQDLIDSAQLEVDERLRAYGEDYRPHVLAAQRKVVADACAILAAPAEDVSAVVDEPVLPELTSDLREILGRPNFNCHFIAKALRLMGFEIPQKSEEEQAVTIYWMLGHYLRDPANWRNAASAELKASMPEPPAQQ